MGKNPIVPYILIFALGIGLIFFMSLYGLEQKKEIAGQGEEGKTEEVQVLQNLMLKQLLKVNVSAVTVEILTGGMGPALAGTTLSKDEIKDIIKMVMVAECQHGLITDDAELDAMADYILSLK